MTQRYMQMDVFSDTACRGNRLAVVLDSGGLDDAAVQRFACWTQRAETVFLDTPSVAGADFAVQIFSASGEMPFAGHPRAVRRICAALGIAKDTVRAAVTLDNGVLRKVVEVADARKVLALDTQVVGLPAYPRCQCAGAARVGRCGFSSAQSGPASLMPGGAVTGSLIAAIGVWLRDAGRLGEGLVIAQGIAMGRAGRAFVRTRRDVSL